jgi:hypothetical protein
MFYFMRFEFIFTKDTPPPPVGCVKISLTAASWSLTKHHLGELIESWMLAQEGAELFNGSKLWAEGKGRVGLILKEPLEVAVDLPEEAGIVLGRLRRDVKSDCWFDGRSWGWWFCDDRDLVHEPSGWLESVVWSNCRVRQKTVGVRRTTILT